jgi:hypothetical protein
MHEGEFFDEELLTIEELVELLVYDGPPVIYIGVSPEDKNDGVIFDYDNPPPDLCQAICKRLAQAFDAENPALPAGAEKYLNIHKYRADLKEAFLSFLLKKDLDRAIEKKIEDALNKRLKDVSASQIHAEEAKQLPSEAATGSSVLPNEYSRHGGFYISSPAATRQSETSAELSRFEFIAAQPEKAAEACCYVVEVYNLINIDGTVTHEKKENILHLIVQVLRDEDKHVQAVNYAKDLQKLAKGDRGKMLAVGQLVSRIYRDTERDAGKNIDLANERLQNAVTNGIEVLQETVPVLQSWCDCLLRNDLDKAANLVFDPKQLPQDFSFEERLNLCHLLSDIFYAAKKRTKNLKNGKRNQDEIEEAKKYTTLISEQHEKIVEAITSPGQPLEGNYKGLDLGGHASLVSRQYEKILKAITLPDQPLEGNYESLDDLSKKSEALTPGTSILLSLRARMRFARAPTIRPGRKDVEASRQDIINAINALKQMPRKLYLYNQGLYQLIIVQLLVIILENSDDRIKEIRKDEEEKPQDKRNSNLENVCTLEQYFAAEKILYEKGNNKAVSISPEEADRIRKEHYLAADLLQEFVHWTHWVSPHRARPFNLIRLFEQTAKVTKKIGSERLYWECYTKLFRLAAQKKPSNAFKLRSACLDTATAAQALVFTQKPSSPEKKMWKAATLKAFQQALSCKSLVPGEIQELKKFMDMLQNGYPIAAEGDALLANGSDPACTLYHGLRLDQALRDPFPAHYFQSSQAGIYVLLRVTERVLVRMHQNPKEYVVCGQILEALQKHVQKTPAFEQCNLLQLLAIFQGIKLEDVLSCKDDIPLLLALFNYRAGLEIPKANGKRHEHTATPSLEIEAKVYNVMGSSYYARYSTIDSCIAGMRELVDRDPHAASVIIPPVFSSLEAASKSSWKGDSPLLLAINFYAKTKPNSPEEKQALIFFEQLLTASSKTGQLENVWDFVNLPYETDSSEEKPLILLSNEKAWQKSPLKEKKQKLEELFEKYRQQAIENVRDEKEEEPLDCFTGQLWHKGPVGGLSLVHQPFVNPPPGGKSLEEGPLSQLRPLPIMQEFLTVFSAEPQIELERKNSDEDFDESPDQNSAKNSNGSSVERLGDLSGTSVESLCDKESITQEDGKSNETVSIGALCAGSMENLFKENSHANSTTTSSTLSNTTGAEQPNKTTKSKCGGCLLS